jgi:hypothetical protein
VLVPVDPGIYTFEASAPGHSPWASSLAITTERSTWNVRVPVLEVARGMQRGLRITQAVPLAKKGGGFGVASILTLGAGALAIGAGAYFGLRSLDQADEARAHCRDAACDPRGASLKGSAAESRSIATGAVAIGSGLVVAGALIWLLGSSRKSSSILPPPPKAGQIRLLPGLGRIDVRGTF